MAKNDDMKKENTVILINNGVGCADELTRDKDTVFEQEIMDILLPSEPEDKPRKKLKRVLKAEALTRMENAARSEEEFNDVIEEWDHLDSNRRRRERDHEVRRGTRPLNAGLRDPDGALIVPRWMSQPLQRQLSAYSVGFIDSYKRHTEATALSFTRIYGERYDWLKAIFKSWSFTFMTSYLYCHDEDGLDEDCERLYKKGIAAFDGNAPTYHIELQDKPILVWDFHSLLLCIELLFSIMLTDDATPLRMCKNCQRAFIAQGMDDEFCSEKCRLEMD